MPKSIQLGNILLTDEAGGEFVDNEFEVFGPDPVAVSDVAPQMIEEPEVSLPKPPAPDDEEPPMEDAASRKTREWLEDAGAVEKKDERTNREKFEDRMEDRKREKETRRQEKEDRKTEKWLDEAGAVEKEHFLCPQCGMNEVGEEGQLCDSCKEANGEFE